MLLRVSGQNGAEWPKDLRFHRGEGVGAPIVVSDRLRSFSVEIRREVNPSLWGEFDRIIGNKRSAFKVCSMSPDNTLVMHRTEVRGVW